MDDFDDAIRKITQVFPPACLPAWPVGPRPLPSELLPDPIYA